jgi:O-antigen/teichoic acid export membrane protein
MRQSFKIIRNSLISVTAAVLQVIGQFFLFPFALFRLGEDGLAVVVLGQSLLAMLNLLRIGTSAVSTKYVSANRGAGEPEKISQFMSTAVAHGSVIGLLALLPCIILAMVPELFVGELPRELWGQFSMVAVTIGIGAMLGFIVMPFYGFTAAWHRYDITEGFRMLFALGQIGAIVAAFLLFEPSPWVYVLITTAAYVLTNTVYAAYSYRLMPELRIRPGLIRVWAIKAIFGFSLFLLLGQAAYSAYAEGSKWIVLNVFGSETVTHLAIVVKIPMQLTLLFVAGMRVLVPVISERQSRNEHEVIHAVLRRGTRAGTMFVVIVAAAIVPFVKPFLVVVAG